jgi:hypothetical protein
MICRVNLFMAGWMPLYLVLELGLYNRLKFLKLAYFSYFISKANYLKIQHVGMVQWYTMVAAVHSIFGRKLDALGSLGSYRPCVGYFLQMCTKKGIRLALELLIKQENGRAPFSNPYKIYYTQSQATARP